MDKFLDKYRVHIGIILIIIILAGGIILILEKGKLAKLNSANEPAESSDLTDKISELEGKIKILEENQQKIAGASTLGNENSDNSENYGLININTADQKTLESLPGIGEKRASDIISYRETNGGFKNISEIKNIKGIGDSIYNQIKDSITIGN